MKIKVKIVGTKIHDAGYRPLLVQKGLESGLTGLNVRDKMEDRKQVVQVLAEGEDREIEEFIKNNHPENAGVEKVEWGECSNTVSRMESAMNLQLLEQMNKGIPAILNLSETGKEVKMELQKIGDKQDSMLEKQDENTKAIREESRKIRGASMTEQILCLRRDSERWRMR